MIDDIFTNYIHLRFSLKNHQGYISSYNVLSKSKKPKENTPRYRCIDSIAMIPKQMLLEENFELLGM